MYDIIIGRNAKDLESFGDKGTIFVGRHYVKMGRTVSLSNNVYLDVIRPHVFFIVGKRGSGKCVTGDTLISLPDGRRLPISKISDDMDITCLNKSLKVCTARKEGFFKRYVDKIVRIKLRSGKEIKCTPEHPLLTLLGWQDCKDIPIHGRIATPRIMPFFGNSSITESETKILAYLIAEGHIKKSMFFTNSDDFIVKDLKDALTEFCPDMELTYLGKYGYKLNSRNIKRAFLGHKILRDQNGRFVKGTSVKCEKIFIRKFLEEQGLYGLLSGEKFIPDSIMTLPKYKLSLFLNRLFSCDGSIYKKKTSHGFCWQISYASKSKQIIDSVHDLLLRFGIHSCIRDRLILYRGNRYLNYEIIIDSENVYSYINQIGFFGRKELKQKQCLSEQKNSNPNIDTIPKELWGIYRPKSWTLVGKYLGYAFPKAARESIKYSPSRQKLLQIGIADENEEIQLLANSDIFWDEIIQKEELNGNFEVYDISVPTHHNFIANDIIIHNSYTLGVIAEGISDLPAEIKKNISVVLLDTMGIYWTMKYPNNKEKGILKEWGLKPKSLDVKIFTPIGYFDEYRKKGIPTDYPFAIDPSELDASDWCVTFDVKATEPIGVLIEKIIYDLKDRKESSGKDFAISDILSSIDIDKGSDAQTKNAAKNLFFNVKNWGIFEEETSTDKKSKKPGYKATQLSELAKGGQVTVLDLSCYATMPNSWNIKNLVVGLISEKLFIQRMEVRKNEEYQEIHKAINIFGDQEIKKFDYPLVWLVIDEAHEFLPSTGKTLATDPLITILREGRQPGISLILASQQPGKINTDVMTQADVVIAHRITAKIDTEALGTLMQSYMREGLVEQLDNLPRSQGAAIIFDDNNEKMYPIKLKPRLTWHGGEDPSAIQIKDKDLEEEFNIL